MAILKCKMCGGDLIVEPGMSVCECEYCGSKQTVPSADNEKKMNLFARAGRLLRACEFDKAAGIYEAIAADFPEEAEAYWGMVLCRYGIEYVDDPTTGKKVPTCHRSGFESVLEDSDFEQACENADAIARRQYREEAKAIEDLRRSIIEVSGKEEPYDIFICYKETDSEGNRTVDSVLAQDVYDALTEKGYRVFFSRITLEDKLGQEYEPYIFAALHSAKVMLAFGTDYEYYEAVWVKNEWSRYLKLMEKDKTRHLIPCYKNIDAYDMPKEFAKLQAQDMGKVGAVQDLLRGIEKLIGKKQAENPIVNVVSASAAGTNTAALLKRAFMFLEDRNWKSADEYCEKVLDMDPENAQAYLGKLLASLQVKKADDLDKAAETFADNPVFAKCLRYGDAALCDKLNRDSESVRERLEEQRLNSLYNKAETMQQRAKTEPDYLAAADAFSAIADYRDASLRAEQCRNQAAATVIQMENRREKLIAQRERLLPFANHIAAGWYHTVGLKDDGTVVAVGDNEYDKCQVSDWTDIIAVTASYNRTVGLKADGTVVFVGYNDFFKTLDVSGWKDIVAVATGEMHIVGLRKDGTVVAVGANHEKECEVSDWRNITSIAVSNGRTVGLRADGTVVAIGNNRNRECEVSSWKDIVAIASGAGCAWGIQSDGTLVAIGNNNNGQRDVSDWADIVEISVGISHVVGLKADGTVIAAGNNNDGQCNVSGWTDIVAVAAGGSNTFGLKADGTVVVVGKNENGECDIGNWKLFKSEAEKEADYLAACALQQSGTEDALINASAAFAALKDYKDCAERSQTCRRLFAEKKVSRERREKREVLVLEKNRLQVELTNLKGLFSGKRRKEIEARSAEIETALQKL